MSARQLPQRHLRGAPGRRRATTCSPRCSPPRRRATSSPRRSCGPPSCCCSSPATRRPRTSSATASSPCCASATQWERLVADPSLAPGAVEECLRFDGPVHLTGRTATAPTRVGDVDVEPGQGVVTLLAAANRDPGAVPRSRPARHHPARQPAPHLQPRHPLLPRRRAGPPRGPGGLQGAHPAVPDPRARRGARPPRALRPPRLPGRAGRARKGSGRSQPIDHDSAGDRRVPTPGLEELRLYDTRTRQVQPLRAAAPARGRHLHLRPHRLRPAAPRQHAQPARSPTSCGGCCSPRATTSPTSPTSPTSATSSPTRDDSDDKMELAAAAHRPDGGRDRRALHRAVGDRPPSPRLPRARPRCPGRPATSPSRSR